LSADSKYGTAPVSANKQTSNAGIEIFPIKSKNKKNPPINWRV
jgi:hypothetical protein